MTRGELRQCPVCIRAWPKSPDYTLRSLSWIGDLPYHISPSNGDLLFHDGHHGGDRFLMFEIKMAWEFPIQLGQSKLLAACARQPHWTVRVLRDEKRRTVLHTVDRSGVSSVGSIITTEAIRSAIHTFLDGDPWRDPAGTPSEWTEARCSTCGAPPIGTFNDGSPRWEPTHIHPAFKLGPNGEHVLLDPVASPESAGNPAREPEDKLEAAPALSGEADEWPSWL